MSTEQVHDEGGGFWTNLWKEHPSLWIIAPTLCVLLLTAGAVAGIVRALRMGGRVDCGGIPLPPCKWVTSRWTVRIGAMTALCAGSLGLLAAARAFMRARYEDAPPIVFSFTISTYTLLILGIAAAGAGIRWKEARHPCRQASRTFCLAGLACGLATQVVCDADGGGEKTVPKDWHAGAWMLGASCGLLLLGMLAAQADGEAMRHHEEEEKNIEENRQRTTNEAAPAAGGRRAGVDDDMEAGLGLNLHLSFEAPLLDTPRMDSLNSMRSAGSTSWPRWPTNSMREGERMGPSSWSSPPRPRANHEGERPALAQALLPTTSVRGVGPPSLTLAEGPEDVDAPSYSPPHFSRSGAEGRVALAASDPMALRSTSTPTEPLFATAEGASRPTEGVLASWSTAGFETPPSNPREIFGPGSLPLLAN